jgi:PEP-CTERM motif-containing protein
LGLNIGSSFLFDVVSSYTNPTGQAAYGALDSTGYPAETNGSYTPYTPPVYYDSATDANSTFNSGASLYTVTAVPEPATLSLLCLSGILLGVRRRTTK